MPPFCLGPLRISWDIALSCLLGGFSDPPWAETVPHPRAGFLGEVTSGINRVFLRKRSQEENAGIGSDHFSGAYSTLGKLSCGLPLLIEETFFFYHC